MLSSFFKYEKLLIRSYTDITRKNKVNEPSSFEAMFNPESYAMSYQNVYDPKQGINTSGTAARYSMTRPETLNIKLLLDGNGLTNSGIMDFGLTQKKNVYDEVQHFLQLTNHMDGKEHEPRYLILKWGKLIFDCRLASVNISYTQFDESGAPLRAELDAEFIGDVE